MAETSGVEDLKTLTNEIDKSHDQVIATTAYIKAQGYLLKKCRQTAAQNKETYSFIFTSNLKLQSEITQARREMTSLLIANETIKKGNVELEKEYRLTKEKTLEVRKRIEDGEKKYEDLWLESKARYESLPFVQKLQKSKEEVENIKHQINELENAKRLIFEDMESKTQSCREIDRKRIIALAEYMVIEMPKYIKLIKEKSAAIKKTVEELEAISPKKTDDSTNPDESGDLEADTERASILPKLQLHYFDFDDLNANLGKIKSDDNFMKTPVKSYNVRSIMVIDPSKISKMETPNTEEFISSLFYKPIAMNSVNKTSNRSKNKLISILNDIKISKNKAQKMIADVDPDVLKPVDSILVEKHQNAETNNEVQNTKDNDNIEQMDTEEVDLTPYGTQEMLMPPTQFLDLTSDLQVSQNEQRAEELDQESTSKEKEEPSKKKAKLDLLNNVIDTENRENESDTVANESIDNQDEGFAKIKDMVLKKHNLDLSPQFVYPKKNKLDLLNNVINAKNRANEGDTAANESIDNQDKGFAEIKDMNEERLEDTVVTSEFFLQEQNQKNTGIETEVVENIPMVNNQAMTKKHVVSTAEEIHEESTKVTEQDKHRMESASSSNIQKVKKLTTADKPFSGPIFAQSTQLTSDFLDESTNNSTFGDGEDFMSCLDTSFLSPKANLTMPNIDSQEVLSQDMPNFLAGLRKTGLCFFKNLSQDSKPDSSGQNEKQGTSGFSFNFGGEEKKSRGGLFSMFQ